MGTYVDFVRTAAARSKPVVPATAPAYDPDTQKRYRFTEAVPATSLPGAEIRTHSRKGFTYVSTDLGIFLPEDTVLFERYEVVDRVYCGCGSEIRYDRFGFPLEEVGEFYDENTKTSAIYHAQCGLDRFGYEGLA